MSMDVAEQKPLTLDEGSLRAIFDSFPDRVVIWDKSYDCLYANRTATDHLGTTPDKLIGKNMRDRLGHIPDFTRLWKQRIEQVFETGQTMQVEDSVLPADSLSYTESVLSPVRDDQGEIIAVAVVQRDIRQRTPAEEALRESEARSRLLSDAALEGIVIHSDGEFIEANSNFSSMLGYDRQELISRQWLRVFAAEHRAAIAELIASDYAQPYESVMIRKDGTRLPVEIVGKTIYSGDHKLRVVAVRDVTERKKAEAELRRSEERHRALVQATALVVWNTNAHGEVVEDIPTWREFTGQSVDESKGWGWLEAIHPNDREHAAEVWKRALEQRDIYLSQFRAKRQDAVYRLFQARGVPILDDDGNIREWVGTCTDVTDSTRAEEELRRHRGKLEELVAERTEELGREVAEHQRAEEALRESEERFRHIFENAMIGLYRTTPDGRILMANPTLVRMLGYTSFEKLAQRNLEESGYEPEYPRSAFQQAIEDQGQVTGLESAWTRRDGTTLFLRESARAVRDEAGNILYYEGSIEDITAARKAEQALRESARRMAVLNRIAQVFLTVPDEEMYSDVLTIILEALESPYGVFGFIDEKGDLVIPTMTRTIWDKCQVPDKSIVFPRDTWGDSAWPTAIRQKTTIWSNQPSTRTPSGHIPITRHVSMPLIHRGEVVGMVQVANKETDYSEEDVAFLQTMGTRIAPVLHARLSKQRQEEEVRQARDNLARAQEIARLGSWDWDIAANLMDYSDQICRIMGISREEYRTYEDFAELIHPEDLERNSRAVQEALSGETPYDIECRIVRPDGAERWVHIQGEVLYDDSRQPVRLVGTTQDVTRRKLAENETVKAKAYLESSLSSIPDGVLMLDQQARFRYVNPTFAQWLGRSPDSLLGKKVPEVLPPFMTPETTKIIAERAERRLRTGEAIAGADVTIIGKDGQSIPVSYSAAPITTDEGNILGEVISVKDMTEVKRAEEALRDERDRAQTYLDVAGVIIVAIDVDQRITLVNQKGSELLGYPEDQIIGKNWFDTFLPERLRQQVKCVFDKLVTGEAEPVEYFENPVLSSTGDERLIAWHNRVIRDAKGNITGTLSSGEDITERVRAEHSLRLTMADLERSNRELEQFAYVASHDLQEPLRMVSSYTQLLARRYGDRLDQDAHEFIGYAVDGAERMQRLINDLLAYSRVGTRGKPFEETDCVRVLDRVLNNLQLLIDDTGAEITCDRLPTVMADDSQMMELFQNLLDNAIRFHAQAPPWVHVEAQRQGKEWLFSVSDNGIGIDPEYHDRIFVIFQRLHTRDEYPGTGIGLAICKRIVERHGGRIWVESQLGEGAKFYFTIPDREATDHEEDARPTY
jgi:PAS domain S-box-containing protein